MENNKIYIKEVERYLKEMKRRKRFVIYSALVSLIVIGYAIFLVWRTWPIDSWSISNAGVFGDSFGVLTCFFTAFAFIGVLINIDMQREDMARQQRNIDHQNFENNFFQMLNHLNEITKDLTVISYEESIGRNTEAVGRAAFQKIFKSLKDDFQFKLLHIGDDECNSSFIVERYEEFWDKHGLHLGHYFRWLYHLMAFVDKSEAEDRAFYIKLTCAQLSSHELLLLYYNASFIRGKGFKNFLIKYNIMSNTESEDLASITHKLLIPNVKFWGES
ncbi:Putative phage abortive infection protein [Candidatus Pantoea symbiotica]|uniref:Phage abortive infection protein n=1 Tax=Candidatus Pantoea symbiotica TaxID=1884370 RepID=A0A1I3V951_9GAMM|nr:MULTISPECIES: putative phage abortive infection protein [Pantoea]SFJ91692.1 Putative phage abortive infection protein [Pantoea symbiotica]SFU63666.1 Putative phage abortive infection protein [Pantoea sp. YR525]